MGSADRDSHRQSARTVREAAGQRLANLQTSPRTALLIALALEAAAVLLDLLVGESLVVTYMLGPLVAALIGDARVTALAAGAAVLLTLASGVWNGNIDEGGWAIRAVAVAIGSALALGGALVRASGARTVRRLGILASVAAIADGTRPLDRTFDDFCRRLVPELADICVVDALIDGEIRRVAVAATGPRADWIEETIASRPPPKVDAPTGSARAISSGRAQLIRQLRDDLLRGISHDDEDYENLLEIGPRSVAVVPLRARGRALGALTMITADSGRRLDDEDFVFLQIVAGRAALALDNAGLFRELSSVEGQLQAVLHNLVDAVTVQKPDGGLVYANQAAAEMLGAESAEQLVATPPGELVSRFRSYTEDGAPLDVERLPGRRALRGESAEPLLVRAVNPATGEERWRRVKASPVNQSGGKPELVVNVIEDVTEVKRAELTQRLLAEASRALSASLDSSATLQRVAEMTVPRFADWCSVAIPGDDGVLEQVAVAHADPTKVDLARDLQERNPRMFEDLGIAAVIRGRTAHMAAVPDELPRRAGGDDGYYEPLEGLGLRSAIVAPIEGGGEDALGAITFATAESGRTFDAQDLAVAEELARRAGVALVNARLYEQRSAVAHTLQQALIPNDLPEIPGWRLSSLYHPAAEGTEVGGDFYDAFRIPGGWMLVIGDVCGRGVDAASVTALARHTLRTAGALSGDPVTAVAQLNSSLLERGGDGICTVATIVLHDSGEAEIVSAGHPPPLLVRGAEVLPLEQRGPMLGFVRDPTWPVQRLQLQPGDQLVLYTDGVIELEGEGERFGEERLRATVSGAATPQSVLERVRAAHDAFSAHPGVDDLAIVGVMRTGPSSPAAVRQAASSSAA